MALSHICIGCGLELSRRRTSPDPHYGLPVVVCPGCSVPSVRRPGMRLGWRAGRRQRRALLTLAAQSAFGLFLLGATVGLTIGFVDERTGLLESLRLLGGLLAGAADWGDYDSTPAILLLSLTAVSITAGAWLTVGLAHCTRRYVLAGWAVLIQAAVLASPAAGNWVEKANFEGLAAAAAYSGLAAVLGLPVGWAIQRALRARAHAVFLRRRQRRRREHA